METYPVDIDPAQIVRWVMAERRVAPSTLTAVARRSAEVRPIPARKELHLGDEEREDLSEIATIATLEITPVHAGDGWCLTVTVEDEAGPQLPEKEPLPEGEQQIDLETFYKEFIRPGRGSATAVAEVENIAAKTHMNRLLDTIEKNRHAPGRGRSKA